MLTKLIINGKINLHIEECMPSAEYGVLFTVGMDGVLTILVISDY